LPLVYLRGEGEKDIQEQELIALVLDGDADAFRSIIEAYQEYVYRVAFSVLRHPKDAEDAAQEAFAKIYFSLSRYEGQGFKTWITRIAVNAAIDHKRKLGRRPAESLEEREPRQDVRPQGVLSVAPESVEDSLLRKERAQLIARYLNDIPDNYRGIITAFYMEEKSHQQIASEHGIALKTVESKLYRARSWMKKHWKEEDFR
jgi:RNA polymerase sigma factor (sigma-70 family)